MREGAVKQTEKGAVLLIVPDFAYAPSTGGGQRSALIYEALASRFDVDVLVVNEYSPLGRRGNLYGARRQFEIQVLPVSMRGGWAMVRRLSPRVADRMAASLAPQADHYRPDRDVRFDFAGYGLVVARYLRTAARAGVLSGDGPPVLVDVDDKDDAVIEYRLREQKLDPVSRLLLQARKRQLEILFTNLSARAAHLWLSAEEDCADIAHPSKSVLSNIPFVTPPTADMLPPLPNTSTLLFVGASQHGPNARGIARFVARSWPRVLELVPQARLRVVGRGGWKHMAAALSAAQGVDYIGEVEDISAEYARSDLVICPVFEGGGSKIKVLEAFSHGRAVIAARHSARGYDSEFVDKALVIADNDEEMADRCIELLQTPGRARVLAEHGRQIVGERYARHAFAEIVFADCSRVREARSVQKDGLGA